DVAVRRPGELRASDLAGAGVVILDQAPLPEGEVGRRLRGFVERGGGLVLVLGEQRVGSWEGALPVRVASAVDRSDAGGTTFGHLDFGHPVFEAFSTPRSGDFTAARIYRYRETGAD